MLLRKHSLFIVRDIEQLGRLCGQSAECSDTSGNEDNSFRNHIR